MQLLQPKVAVMLLSTFSHTVCSSRFPFIARQYETVCSSKFPFIAPQYETVCSLRVCART